jgi:hypothetical protein
MFILACGTIEVSGKVMFMFKRRFILAVRL